ncbi:1,2-phenylacetyl-CoA epoxidase subunit PaaD [Gilvibacter sediminis]|uniref:1,2-phenylacetyl-CoA epoxidase subunit PaaD n=1 Tax=Gilvibacter sediminis TaxID=379071 RepID=UPI00235066DC|nr:1,2-phenylacetyl-CoA epoxidase subunit PaaD [Gilvibacter sediminis]MDC7997501.1 phenylacetate-CoA oxygenase subunit PaaJ [Gilvibacter sediminis]
MTIKLHPNIEADLLPILETVPDPEIPVLTVLDLGVIREAVRTADGVHIKLTPTYTGCPAMDVIGDDLKSAFASQGITATIELILAPAWSTDWISEAGREKMREYGIAPPLSESADKAALLGDQRLVPCTICKSTNTKMISQFGSTACKALFQCMDCQEPFDYFKCLK